MKKISISLIAAFVLMANSLFAQDFVLNNAQINNSTNPTPVQMPGGKVTITYDFYVAGSDYNFSNNSTSNSYATITFSFTKLNPSNLAPNGPTGTGADLFTWTLSNNGGSGAGLTYTWTGKTKTGNMLQSPPGSKYKIVFTDIPVTLGATQVESDIRVNGTFNRPGDAAGTDNPNNNTANIATYSTTALPVTFQSYDAKIVGNKLVVNWTTASETNNDFFDIQVMGADSTFRSAGKVASKAEKGNSTAAIEYSFEKDLSAGSQSLMGIVVFAAGFILLLFNRKNKLLYALLIVCGVGMSTISCRKEQVEKLNREDSQKLVRVMQVDKEGVPAYSKVVLAVRQ